jgi:hypothetical protein
LFSARRGGWFWTVVVLGVSLAALGFLGGVFGGRAETDAERVWLVGGVIALCAAAALPFLRDWAQRADTADEAGRLRVALRHALQPLAEQVAAMPAMTPAKREQHLDVVAQTAVGALHLVLDGVEDRRTVVYRLLEVATDTYDMSQMAFFGRNRPQPFIHGTPRGDSAVALALRAGTRFEPDIGTNPPPQYGGSGEGYRTFIAASIHSQTDAWGMITVDAPEPGALVPSDAHVVEVVADLLAIAFEIARRP